MRLQEAVPVLLKGGETVKSLSTAFLADLEEDWRQRGKEIFPVLREKYPQAYFQDMVSLARIIRWEVDPTRAFDRTLSPEEIMDKLEEPVGPEGRKLFEQFLRKVNKLQVQQHLEARAQGDIERSRERGRVSPLATDSVTFSVSNGVDVTPFRQAAVRPKR
jgi:2-polyprenyl-3-methyl-5-hydroxy-6-metoxy-1,4-benzoquinol methylase